MNNKQGYIIGFTSGIIYTLIENKERFEIIDFTAKLLGALIIPLIISYLIILFSKSKTFGKVFGITTIIVLSIGILGNYSTRKDLEKENIEENNSIDLIISEQKIKLNQFYEKLSIGNKRDILNELTLNNNFIFNKNTKEVHLKLKELDEYYKKMQKGTDSLINISINRFEELKLTNRNLETTKVAEVNDFLLKMNTLKMDLKSYYITIFQLTDEMNNLLNIKLKCKNEIENNKILFYDQNCLDKYNNSFSKINKLIKESNDKRLVMKNNKTQ